MKVSAVPIYVIHCLKTTKTHKRHKPLGERVWGGSGMQSEGGFDSRLFIPPLNMAIHNCPKPFNEAGQYV